ncbi:MAG: FMN-binding protein [Clostridia bacterium]
MIQAKKMLVAALALVLVCGMTMQAAFAAALQDGIYRDSAPGQNGELIVTVSVREGKIIAFSAENKDGAQKNEYFQKAEAGLQTAVLEKQSLQGVDAVSGATGTSNTLLTALEGVMKQAQAAFPAPQGGTGGAGERAAATPRPTLNPAKAEVFTGLGSTANFRVGPGKDDTGTPVYSFNVTMANALFDKDGKILDVCVDIYEVATPNYDGKSMPRFSGWPKQEGYNVFNLEAGKVDGVSKNTEESAAKELSEWKTKRERGDSYGMNPKNEWYQQMHAYEQWMIGKTTEELRRWFAHSTSERNGRPIKQDSEQAEDQKALKALTEKDRQQLYDVVSMATMSLSDGHGLILEAIEKAYENRTPVDQVEVD